MFQLPPIRITVLLLNLQLVPYQRTLTQSYRAMNMIILFRCIRVFYNTQIDHYLPQRPSEASTSGDALLPTNLQSDLSHISGTTLKDTSFLTKRENKIPEQSVDMSQLAHSLLGKDVPVNLERVIDTSLCAFAEFYVHHKRLLKHQGQKCCSTKGEALPWERTKREQTLSVTRLYLF